MNWSLWCLCCVHFFGNFSYLLMASFYTKEANNRGVSSALVGVVFSATPGTAFLVTLFMPQLYAVVSKKAVIAVGLSLVAISLAMLGASGYLSGYAFFALGLAARVVAGVALCFVLTSNYCLVMTVYPEKAKQVISYLEIMAGVAAAIGSAVGAPVYSAWGADAVFYGASGLYVLSLGLVPCLQEKKTQQTTEGISIGTLLKSRRISMDVGTLIIVIVCFGLVEAYIAVHLLDLGAPMEAIGLVLGLIAAGYAGVSALLSRTLEHLSALVLMYVGVALSVISMLLIAPPPYFLPASPWIVTAGCFLLSVSMALAFVPSIPHMLEIALNQGFSNDDSLGDALGALGSGAFYLGETAGPLVGGALLMGMSFADMSLLMAAVMAGWLALYIPGSWQRKATRKDAEELLDTKVSP